MLVRLNEATPVLAKLLVKPGPVGSGRRLISSKAAISIRLAGIILPGKGVRRRGSGFDAGSKIVAPVPAKLTFPLASGRRLAGAMVLVVPAAFRCVVRSRSVKKNSLFLPFQVLFPPSPKRGRMIGPLTA